MITKAERLQWWTYHPGGSGGQYKKRFYLQPHQDILVDGYGCRIAGSDIGPLFSPTLLLIRGATTMMSLMTSLLSARRGRLLFRGMTGRCLWRSWVSLACHPQHPVRRRKQVLDCLAERLTMLTVIVISLVHHLTQTICVRLVLLVKRRSRRHPLRKKL